VCWRPFPDQGVLVCIQYLSERQFNGHEVAYLCKYKLLTPPCNVCVTGRKMVKESGLCGLLRKCGLDEWSVKWIENWLNGRTQRVVINSAESSWRL